MVNYCIKLPVYKKCTNHVNNMTKNKTITNQEDWQPLLANNLFCQVGLVGNHHPSTTG